MVPSRLAPVSGSRSPRSPHETVSAAKAKNIPRSARRIHTRRIATPPPLLILGDSFRTVGGHHCTPGGYRDGRRDGPYAAVSHQRLRAARAVRIDVVPVLLIAHQEPRGRLEVFQRIGAEPAVWPSR